MFSPEEIHALMLAARDTPIADLEMEKDGWRIRISREGAAPGPITVPIPAEQTPPRQARLPEPDAERLILSPGHGIFHRSASPQEAPYAQIGQDIEQDQQVGIVEAMKVFSSITSPFAGRIAQILVGNGEDVEAGQPLFRLQ